MMAQRGIVKILLAATLLAGPLSAASSAAALAATAPAACGIWSVTSEQDEGGPVVTADVCAGSGDGAAALSLSCSGQVNVRYDLGATQKPEPEPGATARFRFASGSTSLVLKLQYEAMDAMFAAYLPKNHALLKLLQSGDIVSIADVGGRFGSHDFSLSGSSAAIGQVLAGCAAAPADGD